MLPSLLYESGSSAQVNVPRRKRKQQARPSSRARLEPAVKFRPSTPVNERVLALKEIAVAKKLGEAQDLGDWPSTLIRHVLVHGCGTKTLDVVRDGGVDDRGGFDDDGAYDEYSTSNE